jgi:hypothetical protein
MKMTRLSRAQITRLIGRYVASGRVRATVYRRHRFVQRYCRADIELLAAIDEAHETLSGSATRRILEREYQQYGKQEFVRLAAISVPHLYNLRHWPAPALSGAALKLRQDTAHGGLHWGAAAARAAGATRLPACGHPRRSAVSEGRLSHQCRR